METDTPQRYYRKLVGSRCYLSPLSLEDAPLYCAWLNDLEVARNLTLAHLAISLSYEKKALEELGEEHTYAIVTNDTDELLGNCGLFDLDHLNRTSEIGIFIGRKEYWGKGYGREAMELLLGYAFDYLNMRNVMLRVFAFNERAIRSYRAIGFREIGKRRRCLQREGAEHDILLMDILDEEFSRRCKGA